MRYAGRVLMMLTAITACSDNPSSPEPDPATISSTDVDPNQGSSDASDDSTSDGSGRDMARHCAADNGGIQLPRGFCASVFFDGALHARQIAVTPSGHVFVAIPPSSPTANDGHVLALFDADRDGVAELHSTFGDVGGNGIAWRDGQLYVAANDRIVRYALPAGAAQPTDMTPVVVARDLPADGDHRAKTVAFIDKAMYVNVGSPSNACQVANRQLHSPGKNPCEELETRAGIWKFDALATDQTLSCATRFAIGLRNTNALAVDAETETLWGAINGRDQLHENWPELFTEAQDKQLPSDEVVAITHDVDRGWPYCYHDAEANQMKLAPEYGGNGTVRGRCAAIPRPEAAIAAHSAPLSMVFITGRQFPARFRSGALISNHGTRFDANAGSDLHGYDVEFLRFAHGRAAGELQKFATGFDAGMRPLPDAAPHRPVGLAMMPDGSLLIGDDKGGRIWRVFFTGR